MKIFLGNIHKLGRLLTHEWWSVVDTEGKPKERYLFLFKARILICKVRRISDDRSVFILKDIVRLPETEFKDLEENKIEAKSGNEVYVLIAHKEETKKFWLKEIQQYIADVVALQEHSIDDLKIDPKQHLDNIEPTIKLPHRIEAYEPNQNIKPSDFAEDYTISKYSTTKATEEIKTKVVGSLKESTTVVTEKSVEHTTVVSSESSQVTTQVQESVEVKGQKALPVKEPTSKIPVFKKSVEEKPAQKEEAAKVEPPKVVKTETPKKVEEIKSVPVKAAAPEAPIEKPKETPKVEEKPKETLPIAKPVEEKTKAPEKVEVKPKALPELKTEIVRKATVDLQPVVASLEKTPVKEVKVEAAKLKEVTPVKTEEKPQEAPVKSELSEVEASVSEKLDKLSQKLRAIRQTETDKEVSKLVPQDIKPAPTAVDKTEEDLRHQEAIREAIQEKIEDDYISESSVIKRIEERYKRNYKDKDIKTLSKRKQSIEVEESRKSLTPKDEEKVKADSKPQKPKPAPLNLATDDKPVEKLPEITKAADSNKSDSSNQPQQQQDQSADQGNNQSQSSGQDNADSGSSGNQNNQSGGNSRRPPKEPSPPSPGSIRLPGFFDPPPPTQYETSIEVYVKKEKYPDPPPKITRKVVVKNEELERKTEEFLRGEIPYEKEDYSVGTAQKKIKNLKSNLGKTGDTIKFAEDTVSKARVGDFKHIKTPGTVVPERRKEPVFEYQYTVEDPKTGLCITTSEAIDFEGAEEDLIKLAEMEAEHKTTSTKRVEGTQTYPIFKSIFFQRV